MYAYIPIYHLRLASRAHTVGPRQNTSSKSFSGDFGGCTHIYIYICIMYYYYHLYHYYYDVALSCIYMIIKWPPLPLILWDDQARQVRRKSYLSNNVDCVRYIHVYIWYYTYIQIHMMYDYVSSGITLPPPERAVHGPTSISWAVLRPISLLTFPLQYPRLLDLNFPGNPLWTRELHPLWLRLWLSQTLWNPQC